MSLKPFTYPLPETRFLHAGRLVYKFKIRYGNFNRFRFSLRLSPCAFDYWLIPSSKKLLRRWFPEAVVSIWEQFEEVIRVILGNLDDLHPFSTDHFTVFPYLSKWERVSKMKFKHENVPLVPYPYICTLYLELNSFQQSISCGKEVKKGSDELVRRRNDMSESTAVKEAAKRRRVEVRAETSCPQSCMDRTEADCVHQMSEAEHGFEQNSSKANEPEISPASLTKDCSQVSFWEPVEFPLEEKRVASQAEGAVQLLQQTDQAGKKRNMKSEGRGLSKFWRRY